MVCVEGRCCAHSIPINIEGWVDNRSAPASTYSIDYPDRSVSMILSGHVTLTAHSSSKSKSSKGKVIELKAGDLVVIPEGSCCTWHVHQPLMMHFNYGF